MTHEASLAVEAVGGEEAFWQFSDALFDNQEVSYLPHRLLSSRRRCTALHAVFPQLTCACDRAVMQC